VVEPVSAGVIVAALLAKALNRAEEGVLDGAVQFAGRAIEALRRRFSGDVEAEKALEALADAPDSGRREKALANLLEARAERSPELLDELQAIIEQAQEAGLKIGSIEQVADGDGNVQNAGNVNSQIHVHQNTAPRPRD
jgi:hypothetical protein